MGAYYTALILDVMRGWIGSSTNDDGALVAMSEGQIAEWNDMEERHETERQTFLRRVFRDKIS